MGARLPPGLILSSNDRTVTLSGTPTEWGYYEIKITVTDAYGLSADKSMDLDIQRR
jgi:hypothetical protein